MDGFIVFALAAAAQAVEDAGWQPDDEEACERTGVMIGSGIGCLPGITEGALILHERGPRRLSPFFIPANLINLASGHVSIRYGFTGPNHAVVTACASGAHAIGDAERMIMLDDDLLDPIVDVTHPSFSSLDLPEGRFGTEFFGANGNHRLVTGAALEVCVT